MPLNNGTYEFPAYMLDATTGEPVLFSYRNGSAELEHTRARAGHAAQLAKLLAAAPIAEVEQQLAEPEQADLLSIYIDFKEMWLETHAAMKRPQAAGEAY